MKRTKYFIANHEASGIYVIASSGKGCIMWFPESIYGAGTGSLVWSLEDMHKPVPQKPWNCQKFARQITYKEAEKLVGNRKHFRTTSRRIIKNYR